MLVSAFRKTCSHNSSVGLVIDDYKFLLYHLVSCSFVYVQCSMNQVAHSLVKAPTSESELGEWRDYSPSFLYDVLAYDLIK